MSDKIYRDEDVDSSILKRKTIAVIGYGIQGKAQAANARDSGFKIIVGTGGSFDAAKADGFEAYSIADATKKADILLIELADPVQPPIWESRHRAEPSQRADGLFLSWFQRVVRTDRAAEGCELCPVRTKRAGQVRP